MPFIPKKRGVRQISGRVGRADINQNQGTASARALQNFGGNLESIGQQLIERRARQDANEYITSESLRTKRNIREAEADLKERYNSGVVTLEEVRQGVNEVFRKSEENALRNSPNNFATNDLTNRLKGIGEQTAIQADLFVNREKFIQARNLVQNGYRDIYGAAVSSGNLNATMEDLTELEDTIAKSERLDPEMKEKMITRGRQRAATSVLDGRLASNDLGILKQSQKDLSDQEFFNNLEPNQRAAYKTRLDNAVKRKENELVREVQEFGRGLGAKIDLEGLTEENKNLVEDLEERLETLPNTDAAKVVRNDINNTIGTVELQKELNTMSVQEIINTDPTKTIVTDNVYEAKSDLAAVNKRRNLINRQINLIKNDPGRWQAQRTPNVPPGSQQFYSLQQEAGVPYPQYLPKETMKSEAFILKNAGEGVQALEDFQARYEASDQILSQMARTDKGLVDFYFATRLTDSQSKNVLLNLDEKAMKEQLDAQSPGAFKSLEPLVQDEFADFDSATRANPNFSIVMKEKAQAYAANLILNRGLDADEATEEASRQLLSNFSIAKGGAGDLESSILLQGALNNPQMQQRVSSFLNVYSEPDNAKAIITDLGLSNEDLALNRANGFDGIEDFVESTAENWEFVSNDSDTGLHIKYLSPQGNTLLKSQGKVITLNYDEMMNPSAGQFATAINEEIFNDSFFRRIFRTTGEQRQRQAQETATFGTRLSPRERAQLEEPQGTDIVGRP